MTPSRNTRRYTLRSVQSSPGRSFLHYVVWCSLIGKILSTSRSECLSSLKHNALDITLPLPPQIVRLVMEKTTRVRLTKQCLERIARTGLYRNPTSTSSKMWANTTSAGILTTTQRSGVTPRTKNGDGRLVMSQSVNQKFWSDLQQMHKIQLIALKSSEDCNCQYSHLVSVSIQLRILFQNCPIFTFRCPSVRPWTNVT